MPSRRNVKSPPKFSLVTLEFTGNETSWLKLHSRASRSHAAYWGGPVKHQRRGKKQISEQQENITSSVSNVDGRSVALKHQAAVAPLRQLTLDCLQQFPTLPPEIRAIVSHSAACSSLLEFCGAAFTKQFVMCGHEDYPILFTATLLLSYAHSMGLTGTGKKTVLLELKSQIIRRISAKMRSSNGLLGPRCLTGILALGAPVVCLVSQDLPKRLSIQDFTNASMQDDVLCCQRKYADQYADLAVGSLEEGTIHRQAVQRVLSGNTASFRDADSIALLQYISNNLSMYALANLFYVQAGI